MDFGNLFNLSEPVLLVLFLNAVGFAISKTPWLDNKHITSLLPLLGMVLFPWLVHGDKKNWEDFCCWQPKGFLIGFLLGAAAIWGNQLLRQYFPSQTNQPNPEPKS